TMALGACAHDSGAGRGTRGGSSDVSSTRAASSRAAHPPAARRSAYRATAFRPRVVFTLPGSLRVGADQSRILYLDGGSTHSVSTEIDSMRPERVWDPRTQRLAKVPADLVAWTRSNPYLHADAAHAFAAGRLHGRAIDAVVARAPPPGSPLSC